MLNLIALGQQAPQVGVNAGLWAVRKIVGRDLAGNPAHFLGNAANPYPAQRGLRDVSFLDGWFAVDEARDGVAPDVLDGLGSAESSRRREEEARLFRDNYLEQGTSEK